MPDDRIPELLAEASAILDGHPPLVAEAVMAGPRPMPVDDEPVLGRVAGVAGLHVAFTHSGATLGLVAGELLSEEIVSGMPHPLLASVPARPVRPLKSPPRLAIGLSSGPRMWSAGLGDPLLSTVSAMAISCTASAMDGKPSMQNQVSWPVRAVCPVAHSARSR